MPNNCPATLNLEVFPICNFGFALLIEFPVFDKIAVFWCDMLCAATIQEPFNSVTCHVAGKID